MAVNAVPAVRQALAAYTLPSAASCRDRATADDPAAVRRQTAGRRQQTIFVGGDDELGAVAGVELGQQTADES